MPLKPRQEEILSILSRDGYATVKKLVDELHYSSATINRDLNSLETQTLVKRTHGGVKPTDSRYVPISFRSHIMHAQKRKIGKLSASFVCDGDTIFIDGSTTAQYIGQYLLTKKDLTVVTNNMILACDLSQSGVKTVCLGGEVAEQPSMLFSTETVENALKYRYDKMFFSTPAVSENGLIASGIYDLLFKAVGGRCKEVYYLVDSNKLNKPFSAVCCDFGLVTAVVSDFDFPAKTKNLYPSVKFYNAENE